MGPTGRATAERLLAEGREVIVAQRHAPASLPKGATFVACDALDRDAVIATARQGEQFVVAIGFAYHREIWRQAWPKAIGNFVAACEATGARMVFVDNLYMYGPQTNPLVETMTLRRDCISPASPWPASRPTRIWTEACDQGRARVAALRAPDFYGPDVGLGYLGDPTIGRMAQGKRATVLGSADIPHDYAYVPDIGRAVATLLAAPDSAYGQAWHVPCAPTRTTRQILQIAADALGVKLKLIVLPEFAVAALGHRRSPCSASGARCASPSTGRIGSNRASSPGRSGPTRRRSRRGSKRRRWRSGRRPRQAECAPRPRPLYRDEQAVIPRRRGRAGAGATDTRGSRPGDASRSK